MMKGKSATCRKKRGEDQSQNPKDPPLSRSRCSPLLTPENLLSQVEKFIPEPISREGGAVGFSLPVSLQRLQNKQNS